MQSVISFRSVFYGDQNGLHFTKTHQTIGRFRRKPSTLSVSAVSSETTLPEGHDVIKRALATRALGRVKSGMVIGLGTGSTASLAIEELGKLIRQGKLKDVVGVGANYQSKVLARQFGVKTVDLNDVNQIDIAFDGVDEVDFNKNMLKGGGAAHTMQKVVDSVAKECIILADQSKVVLQLGSTCPVPVEVIPGAISPVLRRLVSLGGIPEIRSALRKDGPVITDLGNMIVDVSFPGGIQDPAELEKNINTIPGVVENGIVSGVATSVLVAVEDGAKIEVLDLSEFIKIIKNQAEVHT
ncbi:putative ribose-5-phosphate isomerase [Acorus calamus]|uniref:ribose-5-phosphate isomerase n=1 Tax=Acorus calamus TaxID=4465 RepID=A0AAV9CUY9_ACOCL|nr:putative ribose-5-phosphate isomerase [Acorus calamus]